ncbi:MAG: hypothetical protein MJ009_00470 [Paludibacteraceae bacterium]|nr:hypothetical protein [Paludibacteraceae bacterium]
MNTQKFKNNGRNKFPLSTETLDFMQEQIKLLYGFVSLAGQNIIIRMPSGNTSGLVIVNGELLPLTGSANTYITITESSQSITFLGETINKARTTRTAQFTSYSAGTNSYAFTSFASMRTNRQLQLDLESAKQHHTPKGTVIDWYGEASYENIPYGWVPCGGFCIESTINLPQAEVLKWRNRYDGIEIYIDSYRGSEYYCVRITEVNGMSIPDLSGRFVVGAGLGEEEDEFREYPNYPLGDIGGAAYVKLTADESGVPKHRHYAKLNGFTTQMVITEDSMYRQKGTTGNFGKGNLASVEVEGKTYLNDSEDASQPHENRPPYYALYKLIKVI